jgi:phosphoglycolate phosphatase
MSIATVLFDLDGTLLDTAPDLAWVLNQVLRKHGRKPLPLEEIRPEVSHGTRGMIRAGFGIGPEAPEFEPLRQEMLTLYQDNLARRTRLFDGMDELLQSLESHGIPWGVVTNKPSWLTDPLMEQLALASRAACIVSGDTTAHSKPHPEPMFHACRLLGIQPARCLYVGDAERDISAGRSAGMRTLVAGFGYLSEQDRPRDWGADGLVNSPGEIWTWLRANGWGTE